MVQLAFVVIKHLLLILVVHVIGGDSDAHYDKQGGLSVTINDVPQFIPYSTRVKYEKICQDININIKQIDACATLFENKTIERLLKIEERHKEMHTKYLSLLRENAILKQQNMKEKI